MDSKHTLNFTYTKIYRDKLFAEISETVHKCIVNYIHFVLQAQSPSHQYARGKKEKLADKQSEIEND